MMQRANWKVVAHFFVDGQVAGQPRGKISQHGGFPRIYTPMDGAPGTWKEMLYWVASRHRPATPFEGPVKVWIKAYFLRPKELQKPIYPAEPMEMIQKPDDDNIRKMILDVFTSLGFYKDDKQVCGGETEKFYQAMPGHQGRGTRIGTKIMIEVNPNWPYKKAKTTNQLKKKTKAL